VTGELSRAALGAAAEATLAALAITGDNLAYGELVSRHQSQIRNLLRRLARNAALADDMAQQAFLQAWQRIRTLRAPGAFAGWLRKIAVSTWLQHVRAQGSRPEGSLAAVTADSSDPGDSRSAPAAEPAHEPAVTERLDLDHALAQLPPDVRMSHREIAETTDLPLGTVKSHISRGAARLRELLRAYETTS